MKGVHRLPGLQPSVAEAEHLYLYTKIRIHVVYCNQVTYMSQYTKEHWLAFSVCLVNIIRSP